MTLSMPYSECVSSADPDPAYVTGMITRKPIDVFARQMFLLNLFPFDNYKSDRSVNTFGWVNKCSIVGSTETSPISVIKGRFIEGKIVPEVTVKTSLLEV